MEEAFNSAGLLVIDVQQGFSDPKWGPRNNPQAEANIECLIAHWRSQNRPVLHVQHCSKNPDSPLRPDSPGCAFQDFAKPIENEPIFKKTVNSAFIGTDLEPYLRERKIQTLVIVGLTTNHCVSTTTRMAGNLGFTAFVVDDATATFDRAGADGTMYSAKKVHDISLANLHGEFATVITTDQALA